MTTRLSGLQRRDQILECANTVFAQEGYEGARTAEIADRAGVSERLLYKHFETKADLFAVVAAEAARELAGAYKAVGAETRDPTAALTDLYFGDLGPGGFKGRAESVFFARTHGPYDDPDLDKAVGGAYRTLANAATAMFQALAKRGLIAKGVDPEAAAWGWISLLPQHDALHLAYPSRRAAALERQLVADFISGLGPRKRR
jgi:AcrR family transcriptional regulator